MRLVMRLLPVFAAVLVTASCGSDTPTSPSLKQGSAASAKAARDSVTGDSIRLAASKSAPLSARAAKRRDGGIDRLRPPAAEPCGAPG